MSTALSRRRLSLLLSTLVIVTALASCSDTQAGSGEGKSGGEDKAKTSTVADDRAVGKTVSVSGARFTVLEVDAAYEPENSYAAKGEHDVAIKVKIEATAPPADGRRASFGWMVVDQDDVNVPVDNVAEEGPDDAPALYNLRDQYQGGRPYEAWLLLKAPDTTTTLTLRLLDTNAPGSPPPATDLVVWGDGGAGAGMAEKALSAAAVGKQATAGDITVEVLAVQDPAPKPAGLVVGPRSGERLIGIQVAVSAGGNAADMQAFVSLDGGGAVWANADDFLFGRPWNAGDKKTGWLYFSGPKRDVPETLILHTRTPTDMYTADIALG